MLGRLKDWFSNGDTSWISTVDGRNFLQLFVKYIPGGGFSPDFLNHQQYEVHFGTANMWGFPKMLVPNNHGFPTKNDTISGNTHICKKTTLVESIDIKYTISETNMFAPENGWLGDNPLILSFWGL